MLYLDGLREPKVQFPFPAGHAFERRDAVDGDREARVAACALAVARDRLARGIEPSTRVGVDTTALILALERPLAFL